MIINFNVKVKIGPRTKTSVEAYCTAVNGKTAEFANKQRVSSGSIEEWVEAELLAVLQGIENKAAPSRSIYP